LKFVVDGMLGKLARWLRMLGHEVEFDPKLDDNSLLDLAAKQGATLLTRDEELHRRAKARQIAGILVTGDTGEVMLSRVAKEFRIPLVIDMSLTRCPKCGFGLAMTSKLDVEGKVPPTSLRLYDEYWKCLNTACGKIYWKGGHWKNIDLTLARAREMSESS
jgi:uncharacterized protein